MFTCSVSQSNVKGQFVNIISFCVCTVTVTQQHSGEGANSHFQLCSSSQIKFIHCVLTCSSTACSVFAALAKQGQPYSIRRRGRLLESTLYDCRMC